MLPIIEMIYDVIEYSTKNCSFLFTASHFRSKCVVVLFCQRYEGHLYCCRKSGWVYKKMYRYHHY